MAQTEWRTFRNKKVSLDTIDHQHLSNCYWYLKIIHNEKEADLANLVETAKERFNGQLLPYRPHVDFLYEIKELKKLDCLVDEGGRTVIYYNGREVGEIRNFN